MYCSVLSNNVHLYAYACAKDPEVVNNLIVCTKYGSRSVHFSEIYPSSMASDDPFTVTPEYQKMWQAAYEVLEVEQVHQEPEDLTSEDSEAEGFDEDQFTQVGIEQNLMMCSLCKTTVYRRDLEDHDCDVFEVFTFKRTRTKTQSIMGPAKVHRFKSGNDDPSDIDTLSEHTELMVEADELVGERVGVLHYVNKKRDPEYFNGTVVSVEDAGDHAEIEVNYNCGGITVHQLHTVEQLKTWIVL